MNIVIDFDDFSEKENEIEILLKLKKANGPKFKVTLFTIPGKCSLQFLKKIKKEYPWMELAVHGWNHEGKGECLGWGRQTAKRYLQNALNMKVFVPGFKAPQWLASSGTYEACHELGFWVAEVKQNKNKVPSGIKTYILEEPAVEGVIQAHGHISNYPPNYIRTHFSRYVFGQQNNYLTINELLAKCP